jgi:predicted TIM-barrel fold metal-dependent hydrolase
VIVDCEVYYHGAAAPLAGKVFEIDDFATMCRDAGEGRAIIMPTPTLFPRNRELRQALQSASASSRELFLGCALINPLLGDDAIAELDLAVREWGFRAAKLMPTLHPYRLFGPVVAPVMRKAKELQIPVTIHSDRPPASPLEIGALAEAYPEVPVIMDHMGYRNNVAEAIFAAKRTPNMYLMTTAVMEPHYIREAVTALGADRVLFGSNGPAVRPATQIEVIRQAELSDEEERKVLGENAVRLLRLR